jgi:hypothetical protein
VSPGGNEMRGGSGSRNAAYKSVMDTHPTLVSSSYSTTPSKKSNPSFLFGGLFDKLYIHPKVYLKSNQQNIIEQNNEETKKIEEEHFCYYFRWENNTNQFLCFSCQPNRSGSVHSK